MDFLMKYGLAYLNKDVDKELDEIKTKGAMELDAMEKFENERGKNYEIRQEINEIFKNYIVPSKNIWVLFIVLIIAPIVMMFKSIQDKDGSLTNKILFTAITIGHCILTSKIVNCNLLN